ncbi:SPOR domain-containing protein [Glaciecola sp. SC05]|uniref:SPOR domain-containing protein n=1 Tax=Glaciecola sp. SC05 TaxID=1987355 RepID=UPI003527C001
MAQTDYVSRGQKRNKKAPKKAPTPWLKIILAITAVLIFAYALYLLQKTPADSPVIEEQSISQPAEQSADVEVANSLMDKDPLPVLGEEEWAFIDALPEYSVEIDIPDTEDSDRQYIMQCGSFRTTERAQELRAQLALQGLEAQMLQSDGQNGRWYRVVLGPYDRKRMAERDRHQARRGNINNCKIY